MNIDVFGKKVGIILKNKKSNQFSSQRKKILIELQKLFANMAIKDEESVSTLDLTNSFGWDAEEVYILNSLKFTILKFFF